MHPAFQPPCITSNGKDFWVGDVALLRDTNQAFLLKSFFRQNNQDFADGYFVMAANGFSGIIPQVSNVQQNALIGTVDKRSFTRSNSCTLGLGSNSLFKEHEDLLWKQDSTKMEKQNEPDQFFKTVIVPIILFTDDTSGALSKQHVPYESWSMTYAALPFEEGGSRENTMFVGYAPKSDGVNAMNFIPSITADLKKLEKGMLMYSSQYDEVVLVKAPLLFISADNPAHSDICSLMQQTTLYFCRKCYVLKQSKKKDKTIVESEVTAEKLTQRYPKRLRSHYVLAASDHNRKQVNMNSVFPDSSLSAGDYSYKHTGSEDLLQLDSFDPALDTPIEVLHCLP
ncbi:hypothetical protein BD560DRAFT_392240 [Blakeslea trispora]|nr:hypothetical protein BD560DRAFT_392240 [Blakeslea trispora]